MSTVAPPAVTRTRPVLTPNAMLAGKMRTLTACVPLRGIEPPLGVVVIQDDPGEAVKAVAGLQPSDFSVIVFTVSVPV